jgi:hypothetical protein
MLLAHIGHYGLPGALTEWTNFAEVGIWDGLSVVHEKLAILLYVIVETLQQAQSYHISRNKGRLK